MNKETLEMLNRLERKKPQKKSEAEVFLGNCLKNSRKRRGMTQSELASFAGISQSAYASYESGYRSCPATVLIKIADVLKMPVEFILEQTREYEQSQSYKDLERVINDVPLDDLEAFAEAFEIELAKYYSKDERDTPAIKWAGKGIDIAKKVNKRGQDMIEQFIDSVMSNPTMLKQTAP